MLELPWEEARHRPVADAVRRPAEAVRAGAAAARRRRGAAARRAGQLPRRARQALAGGAAAGVVEDGALRLPRPGAAGPDRRPGGHRRGRLGVDPPGGLRVLARGAGGPARPARRAAPPLGRGARRSWSDLVVYVQGRRPPTTTAWPRGCRPRRPGWRSSRRPGRRPPPKARSSPSGCGCRRRAHRQARGGVRAAGAGRADLPVRPGDLVRRPGGRARRQRHRQVALPAAARPRRHRPGARRGARDGAAARAGRARRAWPGSAPGCGPGTSRRPTTGRSWPAERWWRSWAAATTTATGMPGPRRCGAGPLRAGRPGRPAVRHPLRRPAGPVPGAAAGAVRGDAAAARRADRQPRPGPRRGAGGGAGGVRGHGDRGDPRPLVHPLLRPVRAVRGRRRGAGGAGAATWE